MFVNHCVVLIYPNRLILCFGSTQRTADAVLRHPLGRLGVKLDAFGKLAFLPGERGLDPGGNLEVRGLDVHFDGAAVAFEGEPIEVHSGRARLLVDRDHLGPASKNPQLEADACEQYAHPH
jgi:hypothetical protein